MKLILKCANSAGNMFLCVGMDKMSSQQGGGTNVLCNCLAVQAYGV